VPGKKGCVFVRRTRTRCWGVFEQVGKPKVVFVGCEPISSGVDVIEPDTGVDVIEPDTGVDVIEPDIGC